MPSAQKVAAYWETRGEPFRVDLSQPECFGCGHATLKWSDLDRAHLIDRVCDGLDHAANLAMLCGICHRLMPSFESGQIEEALDYAANSALRITEYLESKLLERA